MSWRSRLVVAAAWIVSLVCVGWAAQVTPPRFIPAPRSASPLPVVIAGEDLGFRVDGEVNGVKRGTLVVRVDGQWVEVQFSAKVSPVR